MAGITLLQAEAKLTEWMAADTAITKGQSYTISDTGGTQRTLSRADAAEVRQNIIFWNGMVQSLASGASGGIRIRGAIPS